MKFKNTANLIKTKRTKLGLGQKELAEKMGVHSQAISNIERGIAGIPAARAKKAAKALNMTLDEIIEISIIDYFSRYLENI